MTFTVPPSSGLAFRMLRGPAVLILEQDAVGGPVQVVELAGLQSPEESDQPDTPENEGDGNEHQKVGQPVLPRDSRRALPITTSDDVDMAIAAIRGVTNPATAIGTVNTL